MKICTACGEKNKDTASVCTKCGKEFDTIRSYTVPVEIEEDKDDYDYDY